MKLRVQALGRERAKVLGHRGSTKDRIQAGSSKTPGGDSALRHSQAVRVKSPQ